jgi:murein L,D-transpeptidase YcbB/YkuD
MSNGAQLASLVVKGHRPQVAHAVNSLYEANQWQELWVREGQPTPAAQTALRLLGDARSHGLDDDLYGIDLLYLLHEKLTQGDAEHAQNFDMGLSMSLLRLIGSFLRIRNTARCARSCRPTSYARTRVRELPLVRVQN